MHVLVLGGGELGGDGCGGGGGRGSGALLLVVAAAAKVAVFCSFQQTKS